MKDKPKNKSYNSTAYISIGMKSPLGPSSNARLDFDEFYNSDPDCNNNNDVVFNERDDRVFDDDHNNYDDYLKYNTLPRRKKDTPEIKTPPASRLPVFKLLQVNRIKAEKVAKMDQLPSRDRERSKTLPKSYGKKIGTELKQQRDNQETNSLPRNKSTSDNGPQNKAPHWYKEMYKQMHTSMEGESHLSKLLSSDAKRGAFREYDGTNPRSSSPEQRRSSFGNGSEFGTFNDAPRRLQGGKSIRDHPHRKSLPNIHAANFNFMNPDNFTASNKSNNSSVTVNDSSDPTLLPWQQKAEEISQTTKQSGSKDGKKSVNSEWYRQLQKGGEIPEVGLSNKKDKSAVDGPIKKSTSSNVKVSSRSTRPEPFTSNEAPVNRQKQAPVDFLELRRQELKNQELEKERETIRQARERERLEEEERLRKQRELDRMAASKEMDKEPLLTSPSSKTPPKEKQQNKSSPSPIHIEPEEQESDLPEYGKAKYSFHPQGPGELEFRKGDVIRILRGIDENWLEGESDGEFGIFPLSYVEFLEDSSSNMNNKSPKPVEAAPPAAKQQEQQSPPAKVNGFYNEFEEPHNGFEEPEIQAVVYQGEQEEPDFLSDDKSSVPSTTQEFSIEEGLGKARYTFKAESESELSFKKGDMITILKQVDDNWYEGELNDEIGIFPVNYIEIIKEPVVVELEPRSEPKKESKPKNADLDFEKIFSDVLSQPVSPKSKQQQQQQQHESYEQNMNAINNSKNQNGYHHEEPAENGMDDLVGRGEPHRAVFHYKPANEDEVELKVGDIVHVLEKCDDGWYIGTCQRTGVFGTFPGNYVNLIS